MRGLGDLVEKVISIVTLGQGKKMANYVAKLRGKKDCGCNTRQKYLNNLLSFKKMEENIQIQTVILDWSEQWYLVRNQVPCSCNFDYMYIEILSVDDKFIDEIKLIDPPYLNGQITSMQWGVDLSKNPSYITIKCHKTEGGYTKEVKGIIR